MVYSSYNIIEIHCHFTALLRKSDLEANVCTMVFPMSEKMMCSTVASLIL